MVACGAARAGHRRAAVLEAAGHAAPHSGETPHLPQPQRHRTLGRSRTPWLTHYASSCLEEEDDVIDGEFVFEG